MAGAGLGVSTPGHSRPIPFPLDWVLHHGSAAVQYRALSEVARLDVPSARLRSLVYAHDPVLRLAVAQGRDGVWNGAMLAVPDVTDQTPAAIGTVPAVHRLLEFGVDQDFPPLLSARRPLFRLLAEDNDPAYLYELSVHARDIERRRHGRLRLREAAAAALARMGHEQDPRLRGCANRMVQRVRNYLESPLAADPWIAAGGRRLLSPEASPPSLSLLLLLAHLPRYRQENHGFMQALGAYLRRQQAPGGEVLQTVGAAPVSQPHLVLGDPLDEAFVGDGGVVATNFWLELLARLGMLDQHDGWTNALDRLVESCDREGVWRPGRGKLPAPALLPEMWPWYPLDARRDSEAVAAEMTTRIGIIARAAGRDLEVV